MKEITLNKPGMYIKPGLSTYGITCVMPVDPLMSNLTDTEVKKEIDSIKQDVPQITTAYIHKDESGKEKPTFIVAIRIKAEIHEVNTLSGILDTCSTLATRVLFHLIGIAKFKNIQKDLAPFSREYVDTANREITEGEQSSKTASV